MGVAALISWLVTAFVGLYLVAVWLIENDVTRRGAAASRLPGPVILGHVLLALTGLGVWVFHLLAQSTAAGWSAEFDFPAERAFPLPVVLGHGLLASTTIILVLLTMLGVGG